MSNNLEVFTGGRFSESSITPLSIFTGGLFSSGISIVVDSEEISLNLNVNDFNLWSYDPEATFIASNGIPILYKVSNLIKATARMFSDFADGFSMGNATNMPNGFLTKCSPAYNNERRLYDNLATEFINQHGVCLSYYITSWDVTYDSIVGEDNNRFFERTFDFMGYYTLPREDKIWTKFGIEGMDSFSIFVSKLHFKDASTFGNNQVQGNIGVNTYENYIPKIGDVIISKYNHFIYKVVEVKEETNMFLMSKQHMWELIVKQFKDEHIGVTLETSASMGDIIDYTNKTNDIFNISGEVESKNDQIKYNPSQNEQQVNPFGDW